MEQKQIVTIAVVAVVAVAAIAGIAIFMSGNGGSSDTEYTVKFNTNGGTAIDDKTFTKNTETFSLPDAVRGSGFTFLGWYADEKLTGDRITQIEKGTEHDVSVWAKWEYDSSSIPSADVFNGTSTVNTVLSESATHEQKTVPASTIDAITSGKTLTVSASDGERIVTSWTFNGSDSKVSGYTGAAVDTSIAPDTSKIATEHKITLAFSYEGKLPYTSTIRYYVGTEYAGQQMEIHNSGEGTPIGQYTVGGDGYIQFDIDHCSDWILTFLCDVSVNLGEGVSNIPRGWNMTSTGVYTKKFAYGSTIESVVSELSAVTKTGYNTPAFLPDSGTIIIPTLIMTSWTPNTYTVAFDANGRSGSMESQNFTYGVRQALSPNSFTSETEAFLGWSTSVGDTVTYIDSEEVINLTSENRGTVTLYAVWGANNIRVAVDLDGNHIGTATLEGHSTGNNVSFRYDSATRTYIADAGVVNGSTYRIFNNGVDTNVDAVVVRGSANVTVNYYTVTFDSNGGSTVDPVVRLSGDVVGRTASPSKAGYSFDSWEHDSTTWNLESDPVTGTMTLVARWTPVMYVVEFDSAGGTSVDDADVTFGNPMPRITPPTRDGYDFCGFFLEETMYYNADGTSARNWDVAQNHQTLTAHWTPRSYTVTMDLNEGRVDTPEDRHGWSLLHTKDFPMGTSIDSVITDFTSTFGVPEKSCHTFGGWDPSSGTVPAHNIDISAVWTPITYTIHFDLNGGTATPAIADQQVVFGSPIMKPASVITKTGYTFNDRWALNPLGTPGFIWVDDRHTLNYMVADFADSDNVITIYTAYEPNSYTVTFDANGGVLSGEATANATYDSTFSFTQSATKDGTTFMGWFTDAERGERIESGDTWEIASDTTLYAHWLNMSYVPAVGDWFEITTSAGSNSYDARSTVIAADGSAYRYESWVPAHHEYDEGEVQDYASGYFYMDIDDDDLATLLSTTPAHGTVGRWNVDIYTCGISGMTYVLKVNTADNVPVFFSYSARGMTVSYLLTDYGLGPNNEYVPRPVSVTYKADEQSTGITRSNATYLSVTDLGIRKDGYRFVEWSCRYTSDDDMQYDGYQPGDAIIEKEGMINIVMVAIWEQIPVQPVNSHWILINHPAGIGFTVHGEDAMSVDLAEGDVIMIVGGTGWQYDARADVYTFTLNGKTVHMESTEDSDLSSVSIVDGQAVININSLNAGKAWIELTFYEDYPYKPGYVPTIGDEFVYREDGDSNSYEVVRIEAGNNGRYWYTNFNENEIPQYAFEYPIENEYHNQLYVEYDFVFRDGFWNYNGSSIECWIYSNTNERLAYGILTTNTHCFYVGKADGLVYAYVVNGTTVMELQSKTGTQKVAPSVDTTFHIGDGRITIEDCGIWSSTGDKNVVLNGLAKVRVNPPTDSVFLGWALTADGEVVYTPDVIEFRQQDIREGAITLYAVYHRQEANVTVNGDGGTDKFGHASETFTVSQNTTATVVPDYYGFEKDSQAGTYVTLNGIGSNAYLATVMYNQNVEEYAAIIGARLYTEGVYYIINNDVLYIFMGEGASVDITIVYGTPYTMVYESGTTAPSEQRLIPSAEDAVVVLDECMFERDGYVFDKWLLNGSPASEVFDTLYGLSVALVEYLDEYIVDGTITITASWKPAFTA